MFTLIHAAETKSAAPYGESYSPPFLC